jgi:Flp pilus assembly protein TadG
LGPRTLNIAKRLRQRRDDERGAELIEFALVVVLLITLLYGIITYGLILAAQSTITQAAADAARTGIVQGTGTTTCLGVTSVSAAGCAAVAQAATDLGWMNKGTCTESVNGTTVLTGSGPITCSATICGSGTTACSSPSSCTTYQCLQVTVSYNYSSQPLFPELPGLGLFTPSTLSSTNVLQLSTPSGA